VVSIVGAQAQAPKAVPAAMVEGPLPRAVPGDRLAPVVEGTYPFFSTYIDLARARYVEQEFIVSGTADASSVTGARGGARRGTGRLT